MTVEIRTLGSVSQVNAVMAFAAASGDRTSDERTLERLSLLMRVVSARGEWNSETGTFAVLAESEEHLEACKRFIETGIPWEASECTQDQ